MHSALKLGERELEPNGLSLESAQEEIDQRHNLTAEESMALLLGADGVAAMRNGGLAGLSEHMRNKMNPLQRASFRSHLEVFTTELTSDIRANFDALGAELENIVNIPDGVESVLPNGLKLTPEVAAELLRESADQLPEAVGELVDSLTECKEDSLQSFQQCADLKAADQVTQSTDEVMEAVKRRHTPIEPDSQRFLDAATSIR